MTHFQQLVLLTLTTNLLFGCNPNLIDIGRQQQDINTLAIWPHLKSEVAKDQAIEQRVAKILATMTLPQKVAQMIQPEIRDITVEDMRRYGFGSYLNGGGAFPDNNKHARADDWIALAEKMYQASIDDSLDGSSIPTMWGTDAVHGHNNVIGATLFPHNIGLGATHNPELIEQIAQVTASEVMVTGIDWVFAPTVATVRDDRWGRTYEGYSEDPEIVKTYAQAMVHGLQGRAGSTFMADNRVISTVKHFIGDGGTVNGDDQGNNSATEQALFSIHGQGYVGGLTAGAQSVMASFNRWQGNKIHGSKYLLTDVLKTKMGFDGLVVGDWNGHGQVEGCTNDNCPAAINAGLDIFMAPTKTWKPLMENTIAQVKQGIIPQARIDDAVSRILRVKLRAGLFEKPSPANRKLSGLTELIGSEQHRQVARQAVRESLVLLKNKANILPLSPKLRILVAGDAANNIGKQAGGWTITWQGTNNTNDDFPGGSSIYQGLASQVTAAGGQIEFNIDGYYLTKPDVAIVVFGEEPYAEGQGDIDSLVYQADSKRDLALLQSLKAQGIPVIAIFISGRPMWVNAELNASDAFVAAWLPGSEGMAVADVLLTDSNNNTQHDFKGKLSFSWPQEPTQIVNRFDKNYQPLLPYGFGLRYQDPNTLADNLPEAFASSKAENNLSLFKGKVLTAWHMVLFSEQQTMDISSNHHALSGVTYRTIDKIVQEDAFRLDINAQENAGLLFSHHDETDNEFIIKKNSILTLNVKRDSDAQAPVFITMTCQTLATKPDACQAKLNIQEVLAKKPLNTWSNITIDLRCFEQQGMNVNQAIASLSIASPQAINLSISEITFKDNYQQSSDFSCD